MKTLFTTDYKNYEPDWPSSSRPSARAVIIIESEIQKAQSPAETSNSTGIPPLSPNDKIALAYAKNLNYYKFPGGGIGEGEENTAALIREVEEETGLQVIPESIEEAGLVHRVMQSEMFPKTIFIQDSFHYFCRVKTGADGKPLIKSQNLDDYEKDDGFELRIVTVDEAIQTNLRFKSDNAAKLDMIARETLVMEKLCGLEENLPRAFAEALLENCVAKNPGPWREHSYAVAQAAEKIARAVNENAASHGSTTSLLNPDFAYTCGLLHDIGRQMGYTYMAHVYDGYHFLKNLGYDQLAKICLTHSFNLKTIEDYIGKIDISAAQYEEIKDLLAATQYDDYDRLIQLLDSTCGADGTKNMEARMNDVKERYGYYPEGKWNKNFELKEYFEKLMGRDLYEVIK
jgi:8-oxo-dGTP pyrophosphatase MutT (NUDIX family)